VVRGIQQVTIAGNVTWRLRSETIMLIQKNIVKTLKTLISNGLSSIVQGGCFCGKSSIIEAALRGLEHERLTARELQNWMFSKKKKYLPVSTILWVEDAQNLPAYTKAQYNLALSLSRGQWIWVIESRDPLLKRGAIRGHAQQSFDTFLLSVLPAQFLLVPQIQQQAGAIEAAYNDLVKVLQGSRRSPTVKYPMLSNRTRGRIETHTWPFGWLEFHNVVMQAVESFARCKIATDLSPYIEEQLTARQTPIAPDAELPKSVSSILPLDTEIMYWLLRGMLASRGSAKALHAITGTPTVAIRSLKKKYHLKELVDWMLEKSESLHTRSAVLALLNEHFKGAKK
jgi:hypothetical protein